MALMRPHQFYIYVHVCPSNESEHAQLIFSNNLTSTDINREKYFFIIFKKYIKNNYNKNNYFYELVNYQCTK